MSYSTYGSARYGQNTYEDYRLERCDINDDHAINSYDAGKLNMAYGQYDGEEYYDEGADIGEDGYIGSADAGYLNNYYGINWL